MFKLWIGDQENLGITITAEPPAIVGERSGLDAQIRVSAFDSVFPSELKITGVLIDVVLINVIRQTAYHVEVVVVESNTTSTVKHFLGGVSFD